MTETDGARVEVLLAEAAAGATWPPTPDLRAAVTARIAVPVMPDLRPGVVARIGVSDRRAAASGGAPFGAATHPRRALVRVVRPLALAAVLVVVLAGLATGLGFRLPGLDLERVDRTPAAGTGLDLGSPIPIEEALAFDHPAVRLPDGLPRPDTAFVLGAGDGTIVTLAWRAAPGAPTLPGSDLELSLMAVPGKIDEGLLRKLAGPATTIEAVDVDGNRGWWIAGAPHEILVRRPDSTIGVMRAAIAGDTLVFASDGTLYRLESSLGKDATLRIARSLR